MPHRVCPIACALRRRLLTVPFWPSPPSPLGPPPPSPPPPPPPSPLPPPDNPIVYVTEPWQQMCGFSYSEAVGKNPRLTQGSNSDPEVVRVISSALSSARACKVQLLNYRSGHADKPFWNVLSINPLVSRGRLMFYVANLQDYSYLMGKLVKLPPSQFCRMADHFQRGRRLGKHLSSLELAKPAIYESDESFPLSLANRDGAADSPSGASAFPTVKRLGWEQLTLEPEYITNRIVDAMQCIDATYELGERESESGTHFFVNAHVNDVTIRLSVTEDADGHARISSTRVSGDTFAYHDIFRQLRGMLGDAVGEPAGAAAKPSKGLSLAGGARGRFALAPMRRSSSVTPSTSEDAAAPTAPA